MTTNNIISLLAERVMKWRATPDRFLLRDRRWKPRHYFQPTERVSDAFLLLKTAAAEYTISGSGSSICSVQVKIAGVIAQANERSEPLAISIAVARACGIEV